MTTAKTSGIAASTSDPRWARVIARDASADDDFVYAVRTTGVYCRPSCASRRAKMENVAFFDTGEAARQAGFRPCRRCRPDEVAESSALVERLCRYIESADTAPTLAELSAFAGLSASHLQRTFKAATGLSPAAYARAQRARRLQVELKRSERVTDAVFNAGYDSASRFYAESRDVLGMSPSAFRQGGKAATIHFAVGQCSLGAILVACSERGVCAITLGDDPDALVATLQTTFPRAELVGGDRSFEQVVAQVVGFVESPGQGLALPLDIQGTVFQQRVWQALRDIPIGETASYTDIAERIGKPTSVRAVAGACAANKLAVAIPCHRVVRSDGGLSGYRWGVDRKRALLLRERTSAD